MIIDVALVLLTRNAQFYDWARGLLDIYGVFLAVKNRYDFKGGWNFEAEISRVQGRFKSIEEASSKDGVVRIKYVNHIKGDVFCAGGFERK
jgi:hypothetical protein